MRWSPAGVWSFFQTDYRALQYAGILDQDDGGQLPVACKEALDVLLGVILVYTFYFQLYFIFSVKLAIQEGVDQKLNQVLSFLLICDPVLELWFQQGLVRRERMWSSHWGPTVKRNLFILFL